MSEIQSREIGATHGNKRIRTTPDDELARRRRELLVERQRLPISSARERLMAEFEQRETLVIVGETGSGKSTQV